MGAEIVVVGSLNMDLVVRSPRIPSPGETIIGRDFRMVPGGKGANQAVAAARAGAIVSMVGRVGTDPFGNVLLQNLIDNSVNVSAVSVDSTAATGVALIEVDDSGENSIVVVSGANMRLTPADVEREAETIAKAGVLLLQLECPMETVVRAARIAREQSVVVVLNPAPAAPLPGELLSLVHFIVPNESETSLLTGMPVATVEQATAAAATLLEQGAERVILTLGERGSLLATGEGTVHIPAFSVTAVDTTAAGDAFVGAFAVAFAEGVPVADAVRWANAAGALTATRFGAQPALPGRAEIDALFART